MNAGGGWSFLALIENHDGSAVTQASITSISRTITDTLTCTATTDSITKTTAVYDTLQTNTALWSEQYNFKDDVQGARISIKGRRYTLQYIFNMVVGEDVYTKECDVIGD